MLSEATVVKIVYTLLGVVVVMAKFLHSLYLRIRDLEQGKKVMQDSTKDLHDEITQFNTDFKQYQKDDNQFKLKLAHTLGNIEAKI